MRGLIFLFISIVIFIVVAQVLDIINSLNMMVVDKFTRSIEENFGVRVSDDAWAIYDNTGKVIQYYSYLPYALILAIAVAIALALRRG